MDKNFRTRFVVGLCLFVIAVSSFYLLDGIFFRILFGIFSLVALIELMSFLKKLASIPNVLLVAMETVFVVCGIIFIAQINATEFWYIVLGVPGYDIFAYLFGKLLGGKIFGKARPFPKISKNKTWEGTIFGLMMSLVMVLIMILARHSLQTDWIYLLCGPLALIGDLFESFLKRRFKIKDSNEILIKNKLFGKLEMIVGGSNGHGGFLDRIDSSAFTCTVLLIITSVLV